jgi:AbrB family looped-hinge helix DNA binding protein
MVFIGTITSKRQITIPAKLFSMLNLSGGQKVVFKKVNGGICLEKASGMVEKLAGSIKVPKKYEKLDIDSIIRKSKEEYFKSKK